MVTTMAAPISVNDPFLVTTVSRDVGHTPSNRILAGLTRECLALIEPLLERVELNFRQQLEVPNKKIEHAYFVDTGLVSVVATGGADRHQAEVAIIGREGMTGLAVALGRETNPLETSVLMGGRARRMAAGDLIGAMKESPEFAAAVLRYAHFYCVQTGFTALASARASLEERVARWLLMAHDRLDGDDVLMTHEFLAWTLGVRRPGVSVALQHLEERGLISMTRGTVGIVNRDGLKVAANGSYGGPEAEYARMSASQAGAAMRSMAR